MQITEEYKEARPWLRGALAFLVFMRLGDSVSVKNCYEVADEFMITTEKDVRNADKS